MSGGTTSSPWQTGVYRFPAILTLSNNTAIESILADIPFFSVGLLGFGVFTFFFVMRRVKPFTMYLYGSILFAFLASILDLSQILSQGRSSPDDGTNSNAAQPLVIAREIGFSISIGLRFLFLWSFVGACPRMERVRRTEPSDNAISSSYKEGPYSGQGGWRIVATIVKYALLAIVFTITVLQLIWRLVKDMNLYGTVYVIDSTLEIVLSALFILKLLQNTYLSQTKPWWSTLWYYVAPIVAILISAGVGIGDLACFAFSESTLGRFFQAVELYILIIFVLVSTFYGFRHVDTFSTPIDRGISPASFKGIPETRRESTFRVSPPAISTLEPAVPTERGSSPQNMGSGSRPQSISPPSAPSRTSTVSRLSTWLNRRVSRRRSRGDDHARLWNQDEAERGVSPIDRKVAESRLSLSSPSPMGEEPDAKPRQAPAWIDPMYASVLKSSNMAPDEMPVHKQPFAQALPSAFSADSIDEGPRLPISKSSGATAVPSKPPYDSRQPSTTFSLASYYADAKEIHNSSQRMFHPAMARDTDSPVYGLEGIIETDKENRDRNAYPNRRSTVTSIDELLRQQKELDKSIAALKLFSPTDSTIGFLPEPEDRPVLNSEPTVTGDGSGSALSSGQGEMKSASVHSEFSLSHFPTPPWTQTETPSIPSTAPIAANRVRPATRSHVKPGLVNTELEPPRMPAVAADVHELQSLPGSPRGSQDTIKGPREARFDSSGTQYDVTSFIGHLTAPRSTVKKGASPLTDIESDDGSAQGADNAVILTAQPTSAASVRRMLLEHPPVNPAASNLSLLTIPPATASSGLITANDLSSPESSQETAQAWKEVSSNVQEATPPWDQPTDRKVKQNVLPSLALNYTAPSRIARVAGPGSRFAGWQPQGLPPRPRLAISGPRPPPQDGKGEHTPGAFERPRPPPLILDQPKTQDGTQLKPATRR